MWAVVPLLKKNYVQTLMPAAPPLPNVKVHGYLCKIQQR